MSKQIYDGIIFDIDGTLWDAREAITEAWNIAIGELTGEKGWLEPESLSAHFGLPMDELYAFALGRFDVETRTKYGEYCVQRENDYLREHAGRLYPKVKETLNELKKCYPLYIVSNCGAGYIEAMLDSTGLREYFKGWMCYADTNAPKNVTLKALMERYGLKTPAYVGDIQDDANACEKAGIDIIWASYGLGKIEKPSATITAFEDLLEVLK